MSCHCGQWLGWGERDGGKAGSWGRRVYGDEGTGDPRVALAQGRARRLKVRGKAGGSPALSAPQAGCPPSSGEDFCAHSLGSVNLCFSLGLALTVFLLLNINHFLNVLAGGGAGS